MRLPGLDSNLYYLAPHINGRWFKLTGSQIRTGPSSLAVASQLPSGAYAGESETDAGVMHVAASDLHICQRLG
jgi:hypothetical protein